MRWTRHIQPEGQPYYIKVLDGRTYITETDITKPENWDRMQIHVNDMESRISTHANDLPDVFQIYLQPRSGSLAIYYMVNHDRNHRCIFWIDELNLRRRLRQDIGLHTLSHWRACCTIGFWSDMTLSTGLCMLAEYWTHCEYFPHSITLNDEPFDELSGILIHLVQGTSLVLRERNEFIVI